MTSEDRTIHLVPTFHYDVVYLKTYEEYLQQSFHILDEALAILADAPEYRFVAEQVILLQEYWDRFPEKRDRLREFADQGRFDVAPGLFVMPDMNHPDGESLFRQAAVGRRWLRDHLGITPDACWIADCWGHHAQLPQILRQCGYTTYFFWRCMRRDVMTHDFRWKGLDGTTINAHWLARGYAGIRFPTDASVVNAADLDLTGCGPAQIRALLEQLDAVGEAAQVLICSGGDFMIPQRTAPAVVSRLNATGDVPRIEFSTPSRFAESVDWESVPEFAGEFNSSLQGTFTSNIMIKQETRRGIKRLLGLEALAAAAGADRLDTDPLWRPFLKAQFHDSICGTVTDRALAQCLDELQAGHAAVDAALAGLCDQSGPAWFNPLPFPRTECVTAGDRRLRLTLPAYGCGRPADEPAPDSHPLPTLPTVFESETYRALVGKAGIIESLTLKESGRELAATHRSPFGALAMQMDYGDLWLNFESPLNGGSLESSLTQNHPDPYDRSSPAELVNRGTFLPRITQARVLQHSADDLVIEQQGHIGFWALNIAFTTRISLRRDSPRIEYRTQIEPRGRHYRLRAVFPTTLAGGRIRHEIPFGIQPRGEHEHVAQDWVDLSDKDAGLALFNRGIPGNCVDSGVMMLTLFRSAAMDYKAPSVLSYNEDVPHTFDYAVMAHAGNADVDIVRESKAFAQPFLALPGLPGRMEEAAWDVGRPNVMISAIRSTPDGMFVRLYETAGQPAVGLLRPPQRFSSAAPASGLEQPAGEFTSVGDGVPYRLRPFEIAAFLFR